MTGDQVVRAAALELNRRAIRSAARDPQPITLTVKGSDGKSTTIPLDIHATRAALDAIDLNLSNRLAKLGVSEL